MSKPIHTGYVECPNCGGYTDDMYLPPDGGSITVSGGGFVEVPSLPYWCGGCVRFYAVDTWVVL